MIRILLKKQLAEILSTMFRGRKKNRAMTTAGMILLMLFVLVCFAFMFFSLSMAMRGLIKIGLGWLYYTITGLMALVLSVVGSVFTTYTALYQAKDNDLLLSMPIPIRSILISRLLSVYLLGLMYGALAMLPAIIVYFITAPFDLGALLCALALLLLISVFALILACALGWVVAKISSHLKNKSFITVAISLAFMGAYFYFYSNLNTLITDLVATGALIGEKIQGSAYPLYLFGKIGTGDGIALLIFAAAIAALFALTAWLLSRSFLKLVTASAVSSKAQYRGQTVRQKTPAGALLRREFSHYLSSPIYILNASLGTVFLVILTGFMLLKQELLTNLVLQLFPAQEVLVGLILALAICMAAATNTLTAPSVSLEGKTLWLVQSLPVTPWQVLMAKLRLHLWLTLPPTLLCAVCACLVLRLSAPIWVLVLGFPILFVLLFAALGLVLNLLFPNLNWSSETVPVKQSASVTLTMFGGWVYLGLLAGGYFLLDGLLPLTAYAVICCTLTAAVTGILFIWLLHHGCQKFASLS